MKKIVYNEAIQTISKLTINQLKILTTCLLLRYIIQGNLTELEAYAEYLKRYALPFLDFDSTAADFQHIEYTGCGSSSGVGSWSYLKKIKLEYPQFLHFKISVKDVEELDLPINIKTGLFELNKDSSLEFKFKDRTKLDAYLADKSVENKAKIQEKFAASERLGNEVWDKLIESSDIIIKAKNIVAETGLKSLNLTSVAIVIAIMYYERITGDKISIDNWIS